VPLPLKPPLLPQLARSQAELPEGDGWLYEPKLDGFRAVVFVDGDDAYVQSRNGKPLGRYFPELRFPEGRYVLDGELVIRADGGGEDFEGLQERIHPAASRVARLAEERPATFVAFDLLAHDERSLLDAPLTDRRAELEGLAADPVELIPSTARIEDARPWLNTAEGVIAKRADAPYASGTRTAMVKIKKIRTADCVVGGFRYASKGGAIGSLLLGLYNQDGLLDHIGFSSSFKADERAKLKKIIEPLRGGAGFTGRAPGGPSRWSTERSGEWEALKPKLVCEVSYDYFSQGRFRHGTKFLLWRPDKDPRQCTFEQVQPRRTAKRKLAS
jgi:ATP-dependent DNA ligase